MSRISEGPHVTRSGAWLKFKREDGIIYGEFLSNADLDKLNDYLLGQITVNIGYKSAFPSLTLNSRYSSYRYKYNENLLMPVSLYNQFIREGLRIVDICAYEEAIKIAEELK